MKNNSFLLSSEVNKRFDQLQGWNRIQVQQAREKSGRKNKRNENCRRVEHFWYLRLVEDKI